MKKTTKILVFLCMFVILLCPLSVYAEDTVDVPTLEETTTTTPEEVVPDVVPEDTTTEVIPEVTPEPESTGTGFSWEEVKETFSDTVVVWVQEHVEEIGVVVALIGYAITLANKFRSVNKNMGTMNNNAIAMFKNADESIKGALESVNEAKAVVVSYKDKMDKLLEAYEKTAEAKNKLEVELLETKEYLAVSTQANVEFANELAELLALSNIPNYKKEEIGARHLAHVNAILEAEAHAATVADSLIAVEEVKENDTEEA